MFSKIQRVKNDGIIETNTKSRKLSCHGENDIVQSPCSSTTSINLAQARVYTYSKTTPKWRTW